MKVGDVFGCGILFPLHTMHHSMEEASKRNELYFTINGHRLGKFILFL